MGSPLSERKDAAWQCTASPPQPSINAAAVNEKVRLAEVSERLHMPVVSSINPDISFPDSTGLRPVKLKRCMRKAVTLYTSIRRRITVNSTTNPQTFSMEVTEEVTAVVNAAEAGGADRTALLASCTFSGDDFRLKIRARIPVNRAAAI